MVERHVEGGHAQSIAWYVPPMPPRVWPAHELVEALTGPGEPEVAGELVVLGPSAGLLSPEQITAALERLATLPAWWWASRVGCRRPSWWTWSTCSRAPPTRWTTWWPRSPATRQRLAPRRCTCEAGLGAACPMAWWPSRALYDRAAVRPRSRAVAGGHAHPPGRRRRRGRTDPLERQGDQLRITLTRPEVRNALDVAMRDQLLEALAVAEADPWVRVVLRRRGAGVLQRRGPRRVRHRARSSAAHLIRLRRSVGRALHRLADRTTVVVHGPCAGSGVELPAFTRPHGGAPRRHVRAAELSMGLIPGAGGAVSLPARIGRHRTASLVLTGRTIDVATARSWGLVDEIDLI